MIEVEKAVRDVLTRCAGLPAGDGVLAVEDDLFSRGLTSLRAVDIMTALEERFEVEFPDAALSRETFRSVAALRDVLLGLGAG
ncbi:acyl carrier protein [Roseomonas sp. 18066]|uniref:acyl carrier protein n=1 Tax=Roseomonas sp. 18066 TaxID=2681412 RepID=UPI0013598710|nr:acyl carrier protein [Roseomonas sp. 18066]